MPPGRARALLEAARPRPQPWWAPLGRPALSATTSPSRMWPPTPRPRGQQGFAMPHEGRARGRWAVSVAHNPSGCKGDGSSRVLPGSGVGANSGTLGDTRGGASLSLVCSRPWRRAWGVRLPLYM